MKRKPPLRRTPLVVVLIIAALSACVLPACMSTNASSASEALLAFQQPSDTAPFPAHNVKGSDGFMHVSIISNGTVDIFSEALEGVADVASGVVDAVVDIKDGAEQAIADWQAEREAAEAHAREVVEAAEITPRSKKLEYSKSKPNTVNLVKCSDPQVKVSCNDEIDLSTIGDKEVTYTLSFDGQRANRTVTFTVRDTKAPRIEFVEKSESVEVGAQYDPLDNISSVKDPVDGELPRVKTAPKRDKGSSSASSSSSKTPDDAGWYVVKGSVDTSVPDVYPITVTATDKHGNTSKKTFEVTVVEPAPAPEPEAEYYEEPAPAVHAYVLNTNTMKFHYPGCRATKQMKDSNRWDVELTRDEVIGMGYMPCGICHP